jgi:hypothetical protein
MDKPFQATLNLTWLAGAPNATNFDLVVPRRKRLVIHQISGRANMPSGVKLTFVEITTSVGPSNIGANLGVIIAEPEFTGLQPGPTDLPDIYLSSQHVLAFAEGPDPAQVLAARSALMASGQPQGEVHMSVFGYLVDL